ncbi:MAG TPA: hypothetical protein VHS80_17725, partial [Chthoniobacterales bacterium]|nr:hypothetical protein [Chthoniobacterales bacterium]
GLEGVLWLHQVGSAQAENIILASVGRSVPDPPVNRRGGLRFFGIESLLIAIQRTQYLLSAICYLLFHSSLGRE